VLHAAALIASLAFLVLALAAIPVLMQLARTARSAEQTLAAVEREVRPLASQVQATRDLRQVEGVVVMAQEVVARLTSLTALLGSFGTVGRALGLARGVQRGIDVFVHRLAHGRGGKE
jgi:hypothetical protein